MAGRTRKLLDLGQNIVIGGLIIQILSFGFFLVAAAIFHIRINRHPTNQSRDVLWRRHISILYAASVLVLARSVFRVVEYLQGFSGYLLSHEVFLYVFDAVLMLVVMILLNVVYPSEVTNLLCRGTPIGRSSQLNRIASIVGPGKASEAYPRSEGTRFNGVDAPSSHSTPNSPRSCQH